MLVSSSTSFAARFFIAFQYKRESKCILCLFVVFLNVYFVNSLIIDSPTFSFHKSATHPQLTKYELINVKHLKRKVLKRETHVDATKEVTFGAFGREFRLILNQDKYLLSTNFNAFAIDSLGVKTAVDIDRDEFFVGKLIGNKKSAVSAHLDHQTGVLTASIHDEDNGELYFVEPYWGHSEADGNNSAANSTMLVYKASDVKHSWSLSDDGRISSDGNNKSISSTCDSIKIPDEFSESELLRPKRSVNVPNDYNLWYPSDHTDNDVDSDKDTRCSLLLVADYLFYNEMGGSNVKKTVSFLIALIGRVNAIYTNTNFSDDEYDTDMYKGMGFLIQEITVHTGYTAPPRGHLHYNMRREHWKVRDLLEQFSRIESHDSYCLTHLFTHRKFDNAVLGLAYVASPKQNSVGGICSPGYYKDGGTLFLNSGLTTTKNTFGLRVITREADLVTAHEFGHNWGAEHDPDLKECSPSSKRGGAYVMYTFSVSGYDPNNKLFSPCSRRSIKAVLKAKASRCFLRPRTVFCGNGLVETGEECDGGFIGADESDRCCTRDCTLRPGAQCSDKNSPCCLNCKFVQSLNIKCREENNLTCQMESYCSPSKAECPASSPQPDGSSCLDEGQCRHGRCESYCESRAMYSCMCDKVRDLCKRCCKVSMALDSPCLPYNTRDYLQDGTPCAFGVCLKGVCEKKGREMIRRFWRIIDKADVSAVAKFFKDNIVLVVIVVSVLVWIPSTYVIDVYDKKFIKEVDRRRTERRSRRSSSRHSSQQRAVVLACSETRCAPIVGVEDDGFNDAYHTSGGQSSTRNQRPYYTTYAPVNPSRGVGFRPRVVYTRRRNETDATVENRNGRDDEIDSGITNGNGGRPIPSTEL